MSSAALMIDTGRPSVATALSRLIKKVMDERDWSQSDIAARAGMTPQAISNYAKGAVLSRLEHLTISRLAKGLGVDPWTVVQAVAEDMGFPSRQKLIDDPDLRELEFITASMDPQTRRRMLRILRSALDDD